MTPSSPEPLADLIDPSFQPVRRTWGTAPETSDWAAANQQYLMRAIAPLQQALEHLVSGEQVPPEIETALMSPPQQSNSASAKPLALDRLCQGFGLSPFESHILLLGIGVEVSTVVATLCATFNGDPQRAYPTFGLALALFPQANWRALTPDSALRYWQLLEVGGGAALTTSPLRIDEPILHYCLGLTAFDTRLAGLVQPGSQGNARSTSTNSVSTHPATELLDSPALPPSYQRLAQQIVATGLDQSLSSTNSKQGLQRRPPVVQLCGEDSATKRAIAEAACAQVGLTTLIISAELLPADLSQVKLLLRLCERDARLNHSALILDCDGVSELPLTGEGASTGQSQSGTTHFIDSCAVPLIVLSRDRRQSRQRSLITFDAAAPTLAEQRTLWQQALGESAAALNSHIDTLVSYFNLSSPAIQSVCARALGQADMAADTATGETHGPAADGPGESNPALPQLLWDACLTQARPRLEHLAQHIDSRATWVDLVLPEKEYQVLRTIAAHVRQRAKVYEQWGFAGKVKRGLGISAMFAGTSGTGKTLAAEVIANELNLDLYRIDLSSVVSKYIGETEKNLRRIFDAAEAGGSILLFDEADALFGKRSEVQDSHDRYANMEVAYLLQRIESYRGLAILTTNLKDSLDQAFLRRLRFIVHFPFPDASQRAEIWQRVFPPQTPTENLAYTKLAKLHVPGGNIRNIALNAAFLAADAGEPVGMPHLLQAAQSEYIKLERPLTDGEVKGWLPKTSPKSV